MFTSMYMGNCLFSIEVEKEIETRINVIAITESTNLNGIK